jgi:hypothetical protein
VLRGVGGGQVHCTIVRPGLAARDAKREVVPAPVVIPGARITTARVIGPHLAKILAGRVAKVRNARILTPKIARVKGGLPLPALLAARAARECDAATTSSRASRH